MGFMCIDWDVEHPYLIYGHEYDNNHQRLEAILTPCNYVHDKINDYGDSIPDQCVRDS